MPQPFVTSHLMQAEKPHKYDLIHWQMSGYQQEKLSQGSWHCSPSYTARQLVSIELLILIFLKQTQSGGTRHPVTAELPEV